MVRPPDFPRETAGEAATVTARCPGTASWWRHDRSACVGPSVTQVFSGGERRQTSRSWSRATISGLSREVSQGEMPVRRIDCGLRGSDSGRLCESHRGRPHCRSPLMGRCRRQRVCWGKTSMAVLSGYVEEASIAEWVRQSCELPDAERTLGNHTPSGVACLRSDFAMGNKAVVDNRVKHAVLT